MFIIPIHIERHVCVLTYIQKFVYRDIRNTQKIEHILQVQLRFCLLETSSEQEDYFPPSVIVKVNNKLCPLPVSDPQIADDDL